MMTDADRYRSYAEACRKHAGTCQMPGEKSLWLEMADEWIRLAARADDLPAGHVSTKSKAEGD